MKILITGGTGVLGRHLVEEFYNKEKVGIISRDRTKQNKLKSRYKNIKNYVGDISDYDFVYNSIEDFSPEVIIHTAAITKLGYCETHKQEAWKVIVTGTDNISKATNRLFLKCYLINISTSAVFDCKKGDYYEDSVPCPNTYYGFVKYVSEERISKHKNHCNVRLNFVEKKKWPYEKAFTDREGTFLYISGVIKGLKDIIKEMPHGIIHLVGDRKITMYDLAKLTTESVIPIKIDEIKDVDLPKKMTLLSKRWKTYSLND